MMRSSSKANKETYILIVVEPGHALAQRKSTSITVSPISVDVGNTFNQKMKDRLYTMPEYETIRVIGMETGHAHVSTYK